MITLCLESIYQIFTNIHTYIHTYIHIYIYFFKDLTFLPKTKAYLTFVRMISKRLVLTFESNSSAWWLQIKYNKLALQKICLIQKIKKRKITNPMTNHITTTITRNKNNKNWYILLEHYNLYGSFNSFYR